MGLNRFDQAIEEFRHAAKQGWNPFLTDLRIAETLLRKGDRAGAETILNQRKTEGAGRAEWNYVKALALEAADERIEAAKTLELALDIDPDHTSAMFRLARIYDTFGDDEQALELYDFLARQPRSHINALVNAAVVYEDRGNYEAAAGCLRRVLRLHPNHKRARLFLKSVESCRQQVIEEGGEQQVDARTRLLATPLSEFELSVRAELPEEDEHPHVGRVDSPERGGVAGVQEFRRDVAE